MTVELPRGLLLAGFGHVQRLPGGCRAASGWRVGGGAVPGRTQQLPAGSPRRTQPLPESLAQAPQGSGDGTKAASAGSVWKMLLDTRLSIRQSCEEQGAGLDEPYRSFPS